MIFVTLGTQDKPFDRLLKQLDKMIINKEITDKVIVQAGLTDYHSDNMELFDFLTNEEFEELLNRANVIITHGGVGTIIAAVKLQKIVIATPRLKIYKEHTNDHQVEIIKKLSNEGCIIPLWDLNDLKHALDQSKEFTPKPFVSNTNKIIEFINNFIQNN
ncbi:MAG: glycosyltransferase [Erysipelotrichaceae bacterium]|nr:glycosyltransferase [Erysipelotrichaceae bacterium]MDD3923883.1 glycosyltransferase [Erysipelotrichaceae bacterium]